MDHNAAKHTKRFYRISKRTRFFKRRFYQLITGFIKQNILARRVNWPKFDYEFKTIARKCKQKGRGTQCYLRAVTVLVHQCLRGNHKAIPSQQIIQHIYH